MNAGGKTAEAAPQVEAALAPHFKEEEAFAMPPLGPLEGWARGSQPTAEHANSNGGGAILLPASQVATTTVTKQRALAKRMAPAQAPT